MGQWLFDKKIGWDTLLKGEYTTLESCCCCCCKIKPSSKLTNEKPTWCHVLFYFTYYVLNMFRTLIYPSSGACDCVDELPHRSSCSQFVVCWSFCCGWYLVVFVLQVEALLQPAKRTPPNISRSKNSKTQRTENKTIDVVNHQHSRRLLKIAILMSETCWAHNKWNKIASDIKLVFHSSAIASLN